MEAISAIIENITIIKIMDIPVITILFICLVLITTLVFKRLLTIIVIQRIEGLTSKTKTTFDDHIKRHYFFSHESINPTRIIPVGPIIS